MTIMNIFINEQNFQEFSKVVQIINSTKSFPFLQYMCFEICIWVEHNYN